MRSAPLIGITADHRKGRNDRGAFAVLSLEYVDAVRAAGGVPVILAPTPEADCAEKLLGVVDGVVFTGGGDLDPRNDGFMTHPSQTLLDPRRETFERNLMETVAERRMPVFGIGAGMQLLNVSQGGNLFFHLPEDLPSALPHRDALDAEHRHGLVVVPDSLMGRIYGDGEIRVNSYHHMAVDEAASGFRVTARCQDGVVEAIECESPEWIAFGVQFHPQAASASALDHRLFEEFVAAICIAKGLTADLPAMV